MTRMAPLLERNEKFAAGYRPIELAPPRTGVVVVTCMDHRVDPAVTLGLELGDTPVIRNTGGRITDAVITDIAYLGYLAEKVFADQIPGEKLFEVAIMHHTQCGAGFLADPGFRQRFAGASGIAESRLTGYAVADPEATVRADVERLLVAPELSPRISVSGHVYDVGTGRVTTVVDARYPH